MHVPSSYRHLLPASGRFPQQHVVILWNADPAVVEVEVMFVPREAVSDDPDAPYFGFEDYASEWDFARGNISGDWLSNARHTPAAVFGQLMARGFSSRIALSNALDEFAQIEEAAWAREMLGAFG